MKETEMILTGVADEAGLALLPHVLDQVLVLLIGVQDVPVLADVLLAADMADVLFVAVLAVAVLVLKTNKTVLVLFPSTRSNHGGRIPQSWHSCFSPNSPGLDSRHSQNVLKCC